MTPERLSELIAAYGADPARWPDAERAAAVARLDAGEPDGFAAAAELDAQLAAYVTRTPIGLHARIMAALPVPWFDRVLTWLMPQQYGALAAAVLFATGVLIGTLVPAVEQDVTDLDTEFVLLGLDDGLSTTSETPAGGEHRE